MPRGKKTAIHPTPAIEVIEDSKQDESSEEQVVVPPAPELSRVGTDYDRERFYIGVRDMVYDLGREFGRSQHSLKLFQRLLERCEEEPNPEAQAAVGACFERFVRANRKGIIARNSTQLATHVIVYHGNVNIKLAEIFRLADDQAKTTIWAHLQCLLNILDPDNEEVEQALAVYRKQQESSSSSSSSSDEPVDESSKEAQFIKSIIDQIQPTIETNTVPGMGGGNPLGGIDLMGMFSKVTNMLDSEGDNALDPEKLLNTVHKMSMRELSKVKRRS
jgi:hypothetical protein